MIPKLETLERGQASLCAGMVPGSASPLPSAPQWFAVYTTPRHEKCVHRHFDVRELEHFLPLYRTRRKWSDGSRVDLELPLFPNYLFVRILKDERVRVLEVPGVLAIVSGVGGRPSPLPASEITALQTGLAERNAEPHFMLAVGQRVQVLAGPFAGMCGVVLRKKGSLRIVLTIELIQRSVAVEVDESELETLDPATFN